MPIRRINLDHGKGKNKIVLINAVDDQLHFSTSKTLRLKFEKDISDHFDVDLLGQAHWYLQSRITQHTNYDIGIDQSRYIALIVSRFLPSLGVEGVTDSERRKYSAPLPYDFIASKDDRSDTYLQVIALQEEFGFEYASVIGMLIYLMNSVPSSLSNFQAWQVQLSAGQEALQGSLPHAPVFAL